MPGIPFRRAQFRREPLRPPSSRLLPQLMIAMLSLYATRREVTMPEVYVHALQGRSNDQKRKLIAEITDAVVRNFNVSADAVMVEIVESSPENKAKGGKLFTER
jgi:4-oxalocrotonate tautomerase